MSTPTKYEGHTSGPWRIERDNYGVERIWDSELDCDVASCAGDGSLTREVIAANTALIADAPELLAENTRLREALRKYGIHKTNCIAFPAFSEEQVARDCNCGLVAALAAGKGEMK